MTIRRIGQYFAITVGAFTLNTYRVRALAGRGVVPPGPDCHLMLGCAVAELVPGHPQVQVRVLVMKLVFEGGSRAQQGALAARTLRLPSSILQK